MTPPPPPAPPITMKETDRLLGPSSSSYRSSPDPSTNRKRRLAQMTLFGMLFLLLAFVTAEIFRPVSKNGGQHYLNTMRAVENVKKSSHHHDNNDENSKRPNFHRSRYNDVFGITDGEHGVDTSAILSQRTKEDDENEGEVSSKDGTTMLLAEVQVGYGDGMTRTSPRNHHDHNHHDHHHHDEYNECTAGVYSKRTLQRAYEMPFSALFEYDPLHSPTAKFEASDVIVSSEKNRVYAVCDSLWSISSFTKSLTPFDETSRQIIRTQVDENDDDGGEESGYEAILEDDGYLYVVRESVLLESDSSDDSTTTMTLDDLHHHENSQRKKKQSNGNYHAIIEQLKVSDDESSYTIVEQCQSEFEFEGDSKGFEGAIGVHDAAKGGALTIIGLCEGNHCSESLKKDKGQGVVIVMQKAYDEEDDSQCHWKTIRQIALPTSVRFTDYSAISLKTGSNRIAITSQEDSKLYVGTLLGRDVESGLWNLDQMEFDDGDVSIYDFPKNDNCETIYCNIEGIHWISDNMLMAVSDKMKNDQPFQCFDHDQSVHAFVLP